MGFAWAGFLQQEWASLLGPGWQRGGPRVWLGRGAGESLPDVPTKRRKLPEILAGRSFTSRRGVLYCQTSPAVGLPLPEAHC